MSRIVTGTRKVTILDNPELTADVRQRDDGTWEVTDFAAYCLMPGDVVQVANNSITHVVRPAQRMWVTAYFPRGTELSAIKEAEAMWSLGPDVIAGLDTALTVNVAAPEYAWLLLHVDKHPLVDWTELRRTPVETFDLRAELAREWSSPSAVDRKFDRWMKETS